MHEFLILKLKTMKIIELVPILAYIEHHNDLGKSLWYEVVLYHNNEWKSIDNSNTFNDGEKVLKWEYCNDIL
jgi:hypothetical protein